jgi:hypothetical protein
VPRPRIPKLEHKILALLAARPDGATVAELRALLESRPSQPTLSRRLLGLRMRGQVVVIGKGPATRYHVAAPSDLPKLRSRLLHEAVALKLVRDPGLVERAQDRLDRLRKSNPSARRHHDRWRELLAGPPAALLRAITEDSEAASDLRKQSPLTTLLDSREREHVLERLNR